MVDDADDQRNAQSVRDRLGEVIAQMARDEMDLPYVVYSRDAAGALTSFSGPYPSAVDAFVAADIEQSLEPNGGPGRAALQILVAPLYPALSPFGAGDE